MKINKKFIALLLAGEIFASPIAGLAEGTEVELGNDTDTKVMAQTEWSDPFTVEDFDRIVKENLPEITRKLKSRNRKTSNLSLQLNCAVFNGNCDRMPDFDFKVLAGTEIHGDDILHGQTRNFEEQLNFYNLVNDYNCDVVRDLDNYIYLEKISFNNYDKDILNKYLKKVIKNKKYDILNAFVDYNNEVGYDDLDKIIDIEDMCHEPDKLLIPYLQKVVNGEITIEEAITEYNKEILSNTLDELIDVSKLIKDEADRELIHDIHINWALSNLSITGEIPLIENEYYKLAKGQLTDTNAREKTGSVSELAAGARTTAELAYGVSLINTIQEYSREKVDSEKILKYFDNVELTGSDWILRSDVKPNLKGSADEFDMLVGDWGELKNFASRDVFKDLLAYLAATCERLAKEDGIIK